MKHYLNDGNGSLEVGEEGVVVEEVVLDSPQVSNGYDEPLQLIASSIDGIRLLINSSNAVFHELQRLGQGQ